MKVIDNKDDFEDYLKDASNFQGNASDLIIANTLEGIVNVVRNCNQNNIKLTISGGRTGLTGSAVSLQGTVLSMERFNSILEIDQQKQTVRLQPFVRWIELEKALNKVGGFFPPNPTEINSTIGGNIATNASGARTFKYGPTSKYVKQLTLVLANGQIAEIHRTGLTSKNEINFADINGNSYQFRLPQYTPPNIKNAVGFWNSSDLEAIDLFIGSEGLFGVITEIVLEYLKLPESTLGAVIFFENNSKMMEFVNFSRKISKNNFTNINSIISFRLIEYFDTNSLNLLRKSNQSIPINANYAIWIEQEYKAIDEEMMFEQLNSLIENFSDLPQSSWIAITDNEKERLRNFRHSLPLAIYEKFNKTSKLKIGTDTAVPVKNFQEYYDFLYNCLEKSNIDFLVFGHIGDCHLHANFFPKNEEEYRLAKSIYQDLLAKAIEFGGTISAEHGVGKLKKEYFLKLYPKEYIDLIRQIKSSLDPLNILNSGNII